MATKRTQRIDPNDAFKAIVGQGSGPDEAPTEASKNPPALKEGPGKTDKKPPARAAAEEGDTRLVQKGYYLTAEQVRKLGIYAALNGVDKSSVMRQALDLFFETNKDRLVP